MDKTLIPWQAGFGVDVSGLQGNSDVAVFSSSFTNTNGMANLTPGEMNKLTQTMRVAKRNLTLLVSS